MDRTQAFAESAIGQWQQVQPGDRDRKEWAMDVVSVEQHGPVSIIRIARPERLNAISSAVAVELQRAFQEF
ncbi:MAG: hypothetical protein ACREE1_04755, partial [Stellaceae bacterium]